jgi:hypothetical protein
MLTEPSRIVTHPAHYLVFRVARKSYAMVRFCSKQGTK